LHKSFVPKDQESPLPLFLKMDQVLGPLNLLDKEHLDVQIQTENCQNSGLSPEIYWITLAHTKLNNFWREEKLMKLYSPGKIVTMNHLVSEKLKKLEHSIMAIVDQGLPKE